MGSRQGRLAAAARRQMEQHRLTVYARDWSECVARADSPCSGGPTLQHRVNRGMGGSAAVGDGPQWYVTMCAGHNALAEQDAAFARRCRANGWSLERGWIGPEQAVLLTPVLYPDGRTYLLDAAGGREVIWL